MLALARQCAVTVCSFLAMVIRVTVEKTLLVAVRTIARTEADVVAIRFGGVEHLIQMLSSECAHLMRFVRSDTRDDPRDFDHVVRLVIRRQRMGLVDQQQNVVIYFADGNSILAGRMIVVLHGSSSGF